VHNRGVRRFAVLGFALLVSLGPSCSPWVRSAAYEQKLVILAFDGLDPELTRTWMREDKLPNFAALAAQGGMHAVETARSADGAAVWTSFATGVNAGKHNVFGSIVRDAATYAPRLGLVTGEPPRFLFNAIPLAGPRWRSTRQAPTFWVTAGTAGVRSSILSVPGTFPPEDVPNGELLAGFPLPDARGGAGAFSYFATDVPPDREGATDFGGIVRRLAFTHNAAAAELAGPRSPLDGRTLVVPFSITWNREARTANISVQGQTIHLGERAWSRWIDLEFRVNLLTRVETMARFYLIRAGAELQLYVSALNWHPDAPSAAITAPSSFAGELFERLGPYHTLGWSDAAWAMADERLDEAAFMEDLDRSFDDRAETILSRLDSRDWDLLIGAVDATDRVQHMMWRMRDPQHPMYDAALARRYGVAIEQVYRRADEFVGDVLRRIEPGTAVMIVSGHGFHPFRWAVNLNSWLVQEGYQTLQPSAAAPAGASLGALFDGLATIDHIDWSRTRAYALGAGDIYVNLSGREGRGIVHAGGEYDALVHELGARLLSITDPRNGGRVVKGVYKRADIYTGPYVENAPDLQVGFEPGYRASWPTTVGGTPPRVIEANMNRWSGDHSSVDPHAIAGVLITNRRLTQATPRIIDIAPTVLKYFGVALPADLDGRPIF
jgi:predicted AlkP superfamily phosphohydrolase/phosphomutase